MKKFKLLTIGILPFMWLIYILFELFTGRITNSTILIGNISLLFLFAIVGYIIYVSSLKFNNGLKRSQLIILFIILMISFWQRYSKKDFTLVVSGMLTYLNLTTHILTLKLNALLWLYLMFGDW